MKIPTEHPDEALAGIDMTPIIDVVFQLLLFSLITATFSNDEKDLAISVPEAENGQSIQQLPETLVVGVRQDGTFSVSSQVVDKEQLRQTLVRAKRQNDKQKVIVRAHKDAATKYPCVVFDLCTGLAISYSIATTDATN